MPLYGFRLCTLFSSKQNCFSLFFSHISEIIESFVLCQISSQLYIKKKCTSKFHTYKDMEIQDSSKSKYFFIASSGWEKVYSILPFPRTVKHSNSIPSYLHGFSGVQNCPWSQFLDCLFFIGYIQLGSVRLFLWSRRSNGYYPCI